MAWKAALQRLDDQIAALAETGRITSEADGSVHDIFPVSVDPAEGLALQRWIEQEQAESILEIGLGYGFATLNALSALRRLDNGTARYFAIDPNQEWRFSNIGRDFLYAFFDADRIELSSESSELVLPKLVEQNRTFDFAIVDGNHRFEGVFVDLFFLEKLVRPGSVIFVDDYQLPAVRKAAGFFQLNLGWRLESVSKSSLWHQWAVIRTRSERLNRRFDEFSDF